MSLLQRPQAPPVVSWRWVEAGLISINGVLYGVKRIDGGYELRKADGTTYHVNTEDASAWTCECGDFVWRRRECKHLKTLRALANDA